MLRGLKVYNLLPTDRLDQKPTGEVFYLKTCQRQLVVGFNTTPLRYIKQSQFEHFQGEEAYTFLLGTICGLRSRMLAESEIVSQFKEAFTDYLEQHDKNPHIIQLFEKLFKDAKEIRTNYLNRVGQLSYAGLTKKFLLEQAKGQDVIIFGSGQLAFDLCKVLKRRFNLIVCARNKEKANKLAETFGVELIPFEDRGQTSRHPFLVNTIGAKTILFDQKFLSSWKQANPVSRLFVDLGSPSVLDIQNEKDHQIILLSQLLDIAEKLSVEKEEKVSMACKAIEQKVAHRFQSFSMNFPFGWEELSFG